MQLPAPHFFDLRQPLLHGQKGGGMHAVHAHACIILDSLLRDQAGLAQYAQVPAERLRAHVDALRQFAGSLRLVQQRAYHFAARRIGQRPEGRVQICFCG